MNILFYSRLQQKLFYNLSHLQKLNKMEIVKDNGEFMQPAVPEILPAGIYFVTIKMQDLEKAMNEVQAALNSVQFKPGKLIQIITQLIPVQSAIAAKPELMFYVCAIVEIK